MTTPLLPSRRRRGRWLRRSTSGARIIGTPQDGRGLRQHRRLVRSKTTVVLALGHDGTATAVCMASGSTGRPAGPQAVMR
jgi:hypothetical protein